MAFVIGVIPLPVWYIFLNAYGPELHPEDYRRYAPIDQQLISNNDRPAAGADRNGNENGNDDQRPLLRARSP
jgi:hypothetical protein